MDCNILGWSAANNTVLYSFVPTGHTHFINLCIDKTLDKFCRYHFFFSDNAKDIVKLILYIVRLACVKVSKLVREIQFAYIAIFFHATNVTNQIQTTK